MISIIIPIYNVEKYLSKCVDSLLSQTHRDIQIILVDDGSPDNSPKICDEYAARDNRVIVIHQKNRGVSAARNAGLDRAEGEYIGFVDPDDWVDENMYQGMLDALEESNADLAICGYDYYDENYQVDDKRLYKIRDNEVITQKEVMNRFSDMPPTIRHGVVNKLFKKESLGELKFIVGLHSSEDVYFLNDYVLKTKSAVVVHQPYYKNLVRSGSATHGGLKIDSLADSFKAHDKMYHSAIELYPELKDHSIAFLLDVCTLKYKEAKTKLNKLSKEDQERVLPRLNEMKKYIKMNAMQAVFNKEIYWKTRVAYLLMR